MHHAVMSQIRAIHQLVPGFQFGDAITHYTLRLQNVFRSWGYTAEIFVEGIHPNAASLCFRLHHFPAVDSAQTLVILHYSIHSEVSRLFLEAKGRRILQYHNITPAGFFEGYSELHCQMAQQGREGLGRFLGTTDQAWAVSPFNARELEACGYRDVSVMPLLLDFRDLDLSFAHPDLLRQYRDGVINWLFVGRIAPNKRHLDLLRAFSAYKRLVRQNARLFIVGPYNGLESYFDQLRQESLNWGIADSVIFTGAVTFSHLKAYYKVADVFVCLSEHEGFCIPLLEAMHFGVPIVAYAAAAVPETLEGAGVLLDTKDPVRVAETVGRLLDDRVWRDQIVQRGRERLRFFAREAVIAQIRAKLSPILEDDVTRERASQDS